MSMKTIHAAALGSKAATYHEFLARYSKRSKVVYGFVEGKEDPCFYRGFIELLLPDNWSVELWPAGNKEQVYAIHSAFNWRRFPRNRVCFFVDRDLSDLIPETLRTDKNIYVTDGYSIENEVVNRAVCQRVLSELCGFANVSHADLEEVGALFDQELDSFLTSLIPVMAWILSWRRRSKRPTLNSIVMGDVFTISKGRLQMKANPKGKASVALYIHEQCGVAFEPGVEIETIEAEFRRKSTYRRLTRGKYILWFLIEFCKTVHRDTVHLFPSMTKPPKMHVTLSTSNGVAVIGTRARIPPSLRAFLRATFRTFIAKAEAKRV